MDDSNFDDLIKGKLEAYEDSEFDPSAWTDFHDRFGTLNSTFWYSNYRTEFLVATSLIVFTLLNLFIMRSNTAAGPGALAITAGLTHRVDSLTQIITDLRKNKLPDVVIIDPNAKSGLTDRVASSMVENHKASKSLPGHAAGRLLLGAVTTLPPGMVESLIEDSVVQIEHGEAFLILSDRLKQLRHTSFVDMDTRGVELFPEKEIELTDADIHKIKIEPTRDMKPVHLSAKMINEMNAHQYSRGIGVTVAPHVDLVQAAFSQGNGGMTPRLGITADWIIAPHWSVETSVDYLNTDVTLKRNLQALRLVNLIPELGNIESVELTTTTLSLPVSFKYRWWLTQEHQLTARVGYTPYFSVGRQYQYRQPYPGRPVGSDRTISTLQHSDDAKFYGNTLHAGLGITRTFKKKNQLEADLFYERSLGGVGNEKLGMQLYGVRTVFSFRMR